MSPKAKKLKLDLPKFGSEYYRELSDKQIVKYLKDSNKPINQLKIVDPISKTKGKGVVHLFNCDLRLTNNHGLSVANEISASSNVPLIGLYVHCVEELFSHSIGSFQLQFKLDALRSLQKDLKALNIPLVVLNVEKRAGLLSAIFQFLNEYEISCFTGNIRYEIDELRDFIKLTEESKKRNISFHAFHDTCVVPPGALTSGKGTQYSVFTPWYKAWVKHIQQWDEIPDYPKPTEKEVFDAVSTLFDSPIPEPIKEKKLTKEQYNTYKELYHATEKDAYKQMAQYIKSEKIQEYDELRNVLYHEDCCSHLSCHLTNGTLSSRTIVIELLKNKVIKSLDGGDANVIQWLRQVAWRDFYKHVLANWPHTGMFKPFHLEFSTVEWEYNKEHLDAWCEGRTGYPIVDACMRQLNQTGYMPNRGRMIVASFLSKHLMIDWRHGERYFMEALIDGDAASNNGGWGFSSSTGVDPQPYFRIFNPYLQAERFDAKGDYIRKWIPELRHLKGKAVHKPYEHTDENLDYPKPIVDHKLARERALQRYKDAKY